MPRKHRKRQPPTAGETVSWFEEQPIELARTVLEIVAVRVAKRTDVRDARLLTPPEEPLGARRSAAAARATGKRKTASAPAAPAEYGETIADA